MRIRSLKLIQIRQFDFLDSKNFNPHLNIIVGKNARGKTTLLEAISLLTTLKSFRTTTLGDLIQEGKTEASVTAEIDQPSAHQIVFGMSAGKKLIKLDGQAISSRGKYPFMGSSISFVPDDLYLVKGSAEARRHFLDQVALGLDPAYAQVLQRFEKALKQRNKILKSIKVGEAKAGDEIFWREVFIEAAIAVYLRRSQLCQHLSSTLPTVYEQLFKVSEALSVHYTPQIEIDDSPVLVKTKLNDRIEERFVAEMAVGYSLIGPHRDDIHFGLNGRDVRTFASQGQIRGLVVALKIAQLEIARAQSSGTPVLLLDDIISELDDDRVHALVNYLGKYPGQLFVSTAEISKVATLHERFSSFEVFNLDDQILTRREGSKSPSEGLIEEPLSVSFSL